MLKPWRAWLMRPSHAPCTQGLRALLQRLTLGAYPGVIKAAMAVFDLPEAIAVTRSALCAAGGSLAVVSRLQVGPPPDVGGVVQGRVWCRLICGCQPVLARALAAMDLLCLTSSGCALVLAQAMAYYGGMLAYFWLLATPAVSVPTCHSQVSQPISFLSCAPLSSLPPP